MRAESEILCEGTLGGVWSDMKVYRGGVCITVPKTVMPNGRVRKEIRQLIARCTAGSPKVIERLRNYGVVVENG